MLVFLFIIASASMALPVTNAASNCSVCNLGGLYTESNGYGCFHLNNEDVACTCPDLRYKLNEPCRICGRKDICGDDPNNVCSEISPSLGVQGNSTKYFVCFCTDMSYVKGGPCPSTITITTITPSTTTVTAAPSA